MNLARLVLAAFRMTRNRRDESTEESSKPFDAMKTPSYSKTSLNAGFKNTSLQIVSLPAAEPAGRESDTVLLQELSSRRAGTQAAQRICDVVFCTAALLLLWPVFAVIALLIRLDSPGPVLFKQSRVGKDGVEFWFYKFRSMVSDAEAQRHLLEMQNERSGPVFKMKNDPRITRVGRVLRKFSLDELPQLINVLKGDMSLVGPRPALPTETDKYTARQRQRLICLPGVTGLWQVSGRASLSFERSIELDLYYIERQSVGLYFRILLLTIPAVLRAEGAY
jgi:lipopolysaccharide/colanic/teichoic acid biosynthesis glycosyltransferase